MAHRFVALKVTPETRRRLEETAAKNGRNLSDEMREALRHHLARERQAVDAPSDAPKRPE